MKSKGKNLGPFSYIWERPLRNISETKVLMKSPDPREEEVKGINRKVPTKRGPLSFRIKDRRGTK